MEEKDFVETITLTRRSYNSLIDTDRNYQSVCGEIDELKDINAKCKLENTELKKYIFDKFIEKNAFMAEVFNYKEILKERFNGSNSECTELENIIGREAVERFLKEYYDTKREVR